MSCVAAIQTQSSDNIAENLARVETWIEHAASENSSLVVLPECFGFMQSSLAQLLSVAEQPGNGLIQNTVSALARRCQCWIIAGSIPMISDTPGKVTNTLVVYNDDGVEVARYDKIFLFDVSLPNGEHYHESEYTKAGDVASVVDTPIGKVGLSICYDLRFPEMYRKLVSLGAEVLVVASAFSATTGKAHWLPLLRARAIENSCYVVAPAQFGRHNQKRTTWGHTVIIDPWGAVLTELDTGWGVASAKIDLAKLEAYRARLPSLQHIRSDLF